jgi:hypothetical protein
LRQDLRHVIVRDKLSFVELCEYPFSEGFLDWFEVDLSEPGEYAVFPVPICQESVKVRVIIKRLAGCLHSEDSGEFPLVDAECLRYCSPGSTKENGIELTVVLKEDSQAFRDGEDRVAMGDVLDHFAVDVLCKLHCPLSSAGGAYPAALAGEGDKEGVFAPVAIHSRDAVR